MKKYLCYLPVLFLSLILFSSCEEDEEGGDGPVADLEEASSSLEGTFTAFKVEEGAGLYEDDEIGDWSSFKLTFSAVTETGGKYSVVGIPEGFEYLWPTKGVFTFDQTTAAVILVRDDEIRMSSSEREEHIILSVLSISSPKVEGVEEDWDFFIKKES
ncbi:hypothetical protein [Reichenbachiella versicolor]|uniref:hypothetical protein n=1 Tax=Reichenbachiella versicolor TaxID=1821036 RepID=UPI000D6E1A6A|nr:hypothetical protein [Reichenbachiella versicolor]